MENMSDSRREQLFAMGKFKVRLTTVLESMREEHRFSDSDMHDLTHAFMVAAGSNIDDMVRIYRGRQSLVDAVREGLQQAGESMTYEPGHETDVADGILASRGVSLDQMRAFYLQQERTIITRGLEAQVAGSTAHPIIQGVLGHLYPQEQ